MNRPSGNRERQDSGVVKPSFWALRRYANQVRHSHLNAGMERFYTELNRFNFGHFRLLYDVIITSHSVAFSDTFHAVWAIREKARKPSVGGPLRVGSGGRI